MEVQMRFACLNLDEKYKSLRSPPSITAFPEAYGMFVHKAAKSP
jgi:hypothetical protein